MMDEYYDVPRDIRELFDNGNHSYSIIDPGLSLDNIEAMQIFLEMLDVTEDLIESDYGTRVILNNGSRQLQIDCGGLGDFHLHGYDVTVI